MVFVCPPKEDTEAVTKISAKLKEALQQLDTHLSVGVKPICVPCCMPICDYPMPPAEPKNEEHKKEFDPPKVMVCYREPAKKSKGKNQGAHQVREEGVIRLHQSKSRELRASILYTGCQCEKRDGLQDDCPRTGCHGSPECLTQPPTCGPSEFCDGKHLGKKKDTYLRKNGNGAKNENGDSKETTHDVARYKCFAASVEPPICVPIAPCPPCCVPCPRI